jgi:hypothetical protein
MKKLVLLPMLLALLVVASVAMAAQPGSEVRGHGKVQIGDPADVSVSQIVVDAWTDADGVHGMLEWTGGVGPDAVPPAVPWHMDVTSIDVTGNTATVCWVVVHSVFPDDIGADGCFDFTDNRATGSPDEIDGEPIQAGNIVIR